jgi:hypothetical protein
MPIKLNTASGGGVILTGANTATDKTITVPAADGNMLYADASGNAQINSGYGSLATGYVARAWVNFNGTGTVAIRASGNVSSITDNGTGYYTVNFTTAMPDANYSACCSGRNSASTTIPLVSSAISFSTTSCTLRFLTVSNADQDSDFVSAAIFR